jgi:hypothetical protein
VAGDPGRPVDFLQEFPGLAVRFRGIFGRSAFHEGAAQELRHQDAGLRRGVPQYRNPAGQPLESDPVGCDFAADMVTGGARLDDEFVAAGRGNVEDCGVLQGPAVVPHHAECTEPGCQQPALLVGDPWAHPLSMPRVDPPAWPGLPTN